MAHDLSAALAVACLLLRDGIEVERIEGPDPDHVQLGSQAIQGLCDATLFADPSSSPALDLMSFCLILASSASATMTSLSIS
jgi:hypothetical protein